MSKSSNVQDIRNAVGKIKEVTAFLLSKKTEKNNGQLKLLSKTKWVERQDYVLVFKEKKYL